MENPSATPLPIDISNVEKLRDDGHFEPILDRLLYWYEWSGRDAGRLSGEFKSIGPAIKVAREILHNTSQQGGADASLRKDKLERFLWDSIPGKSNFEYTTDDKGVFLKLQGDNLMTTLCENVLYLDRHFDDGKNRFARIWLVFNPGTIFWLFNTKDSQIVDDFLERVRSGKLSQHLISDAEISRVDRWVDYQRRKSSGSLEENDVQPQVPAIGILIRGVNSGKNLDDVMKQIDETFSISEIVNERPGGSSERYKMDVF